ncbi:hypothetical protein [Kribbella sp. VKM Ac-2568]|uniref:hypothetical protein n=1 Tax=Kribbella sp. VKM Ac-2568 TaxID=2512219 RepID=UPI001042ED17|nr:hypothetical protein [Kribbella sp. VKM Ac-2568]
MAPRRWTRFVAVAGLLTLTILALPAPAAATTRATPDDAGRQLAERYAPVVKLQVDASRCDEGEQFQPTDVEAVLGNQQVALRGPWRPPDLVRTQPEAKDISLGFPGHFLDFPGDPLRPGCGYAEWSADINAAFPATVYAHLASDPKFPDKLSLEYWFFYVFNDYNNTHEGDWESIQLIFDAPDPAAALAQEPIAVGYSQHGGAERALWGDKKLEVVDGTHPVVYPAAGSHANKYGQRLYLGRGSEGLGCDDTTRPKAGMTPRVAYVPLATTDYVAAYPWLGFEGRWGERQRSFFDGPTGPNMKESWVTPIQDAEVTWRDDSTTVPAGSILGPSSTTVFCAAVATGSNLLRETLDRLWLLILLLVAGVALVWFAASRTRWSDADPLPARKKRAWGQAVVSSARLFLGRPGTFAGFVLVFVVLSLVTVTLAGLQADRRDAPADLGAPTQNPAGFWLSVVALVTTILTLVAYVSMMAALTRTLDQLDRGQSVTTGDALRHVISLWRPLARVALQYYVVLAALTFFVATIPVAIYYAVSRAFAIPIVVAEGCSGSEALKRSRRLVQGRWWRTAVPLVIVVGLGVAAGPIAGIILLLATDLSASLINLVSSLLFAVAMPLAALAVAYLYFDRAVAVRQETPPAGPAATPTGPGRGDAQGSERPAVL